VVVILMGVAGSGKTVIGRALAEILRYRFVDGDDYHPVANVDRMRRGDPLTDTDRAPWLADLHNVVARAIDRRESLVLACSALKQSHRQRLAAGLRTVRFVHLTADEPTLLRRLEVRPGHFAGPALLASQMATLEQPTEAFVVDATRPVDEVVSLIRQEFGL
jgi:carbohydrate kinase (thermoresistant glucokinase family)